MNELHDAHVETWRDWRYGNAGQFLARLDPEAETFTFQTFDDTPAERGDLAHIIHGDFGQRTKALDALQEQRAGIFVTVNQTDNKGRQAHNIKRVRAVFVDLDGAPLAPVIEAGLQPHIVCESSPGRWHAYWLCDDCALDQFTRVQKALALRFDGDPSICDLSRVMRLPGFLHQKAEPFMTRMLPELCANIPPYALAEIVGSLKLDLNAHEEPKRAQGKTPDGKITPGGRRSHLFASGRSMAKRLSREAVRAALIAENAARCEPPLDACHVDYAAERAFTAKDSEGWQDEPHQRTDQGGEFHHHARADDQRIAIGGAFTIAHAMPDISYVMKPALIQGQITALTAKTGHGKSTLATALAFALALGRNLGPLTPEADGLIYVISAEDGDGMRMRVFAEGARHKLNDEQRKSVDAVLRWMPSTEGASVSKLLELVTADAAGRDVVLVIVDTGPAVFDVSDENDNTEMQRQVESLKRFTSLPGRPTTLVLMHPTKNATADNLVPRGGGSFLGGLDTNLTLWNDEGSVKFHHGKLRGANFDPIEFKLDPITIELPSGKVTTSCIARPVDDIEAVAGYKRGAETNRKVLLAMYFRNAPMVLRDFEPEVKRSTADEALTRLVRDKLVERKSTDPGYTLTASGRKLAKQYMATGGKDYRAGRDGE